MICQCKACIWLQRVLVGGISIKEYSSVSWCRGVRCDKQSLFCRRGCIPDTSNVLLGGWVKIDGLWVYFTKCLCISVYVAHSLSAYELHWNLQVLCCSPRTPFHFEYCSRDSRLRWTELCGMMKPWIRLGLYMYEQGHRMGRSMLHLLALQLRWERELELFSEIRPTNANFLDYWHYMDHMCWIIDVHCELFFEQF